MCEPFVFNILNENQRKYESADYPITNNWNLQLHANMN